MLSSFSEMLSTQQPVELQDDTILHLLGRSGLWQLIFDLSRLVRQGLKSASHANMLDFVSKKQPVSCLQHSHLSCVTSYILQAPAWAHQNIPDPSIFSGTTKHKNEVAGESQDTALEQATTSKLLHTSTVWQMLCVLWCNTLQGVAATEQQM